MAQVGITGHGAPRQRSGADPVVARPRATTARAVRGKTGWAGAYARRLATTDAVVVTATVGVAQVIRFRGDGSRVDVSGYETTYLLVSILVGVLWWVALALFATRDSRIVGVGAEEYKRVLHTSLRLFATIAIIAFLAQADLSRGYLGVAFLLGTVGLLLTRWRWRRWLHAQRVHGRSCDTVLVVGTRDQAQHLASELERHPFAGLRVIGACVPGGTIGDHLTSGVPVLGGVRDAAHAAVHAEASTVAVTASEIISSHVLRRLGWELEVHDVDLIVAPSLTDVAGSRIHTRRVAGLPLLHVEAPRYEGASRVAKRVFDLTATTLGLLLLSPVLLATAIAVRLDGPGPILFRQQRVGLGGRSFCMVKFRSMVGDAEQQMASLRESNPCSGPLFKMRHDPRVTRVGRVLRKYSLDELPQLINVLTGEMSLVGPRPPLATEVEQYTVEQHRRFLVRPGLTGLWQVSGRSNLSWEDSARLDLYYVENWSLMEDIVILAKTARAVVTSSGAY